MVENKLRWFGHIEKTYRFCGKESRSDGGEAE